MIYMLDTNTVSLIAQNNDSAIKNLLKHDKDTICISAIVYAEIFYGLEKKGSMRLINEVNSVLKKMTIISFDESHSEFYGKIRTTLEKSGNPLDNMDILIAASALAAKATLVSNNVKHFSRIKGLKIEDWSK